MLVNTLSSLFPAGVASCGLHLAASLQRAAAHVLQHRGFTAAAGTAPITDQDRIFQNLYGLHDTSLKVLPQV